jgi:FtsP/CotA-like multicopper oxidase with cupredoxin domain
VPSLEPTVLDFEFRNATNLDTHPIHFHGTKWHLVDADHMVEDWFILGGKKPVALSHMEFTRRPTPLT